MARVDIWDPGQAQVKPTCNASTLICNEIALPDRLLGLLRRDASICAALDCTVSSSLLPARLDSTLV
jgi:hypothetical protein